MKSPRPRVILEPPYNAPLHFDDSSLVIASSVTTDPLPTVFLHGGWRCASTYVWTRFRASPLTTCFYEPFAERLAHSSAKRIGRDTAGGWDSRHPALSTPYRAEYLPLLHRLRRGVRGYHEPLALARYFPCGDLARERSYLDRLIEYARGRGTRPVLGFSRSLARAGALKRALGGYHIVIRRDPREQWISCRSYRQQGSLSYFELCHLLILALAPPGSPAGALARSLRLPRPPPWAWTLRRQLDALQAVVHPGSEELSYRAFIGVYLLSHAMARPAADLVLDMDRLGGSAQYRDDVRACILERTGVAVDFSDCALPHRSGAQDAVDFPAVEADVRECLAAAGVDLHESLAPPPAAPGPVAQSSPGSCATTVRPSAGKW